MTHIYEKIPQGYKDSPLGVIPQEWEVKRIGDSCNILVGKDLQESNYSAVQHGKYNIPIYSNTIENWGLYGYYDFEEYKGESVTVVGRGVGIGTAFARDNGFGAIGRLLVLYPNKDVHYKFITNYINKQVNILVENAAIPQLTGIQFSSYKILLPPLPEQQKIAEILTCWDDAIEKQTKLIEKLEIRKRGLMQQLLTGKKRLKGFEGEWKKYQYCDILKSIQRNMIWNDDELYDLISVKRRSGGLFLRESLFGHQIKTKKLRPAFEGDFLISKMQIVHGASGLTTNEFHDKKISDSYIAVIPKDRNVLNIGYLNLASQIPYFYHQTYISSYGVHIEKMTFDFETFMSLSINIPPISEQTTIVNTLSVADEEIGKAKEKLSALKVQKKGLMQVLLTGKKRVKI
jgi:type I restriction enzyme S subunit